MEDSTAVESARSSPWDVFIHLLAVIALYASVYAALTLLYQFINIAIPDPLDNVITQDDRIRYAVAILVVSFPTYWWAWRLIETDLRANPSKAKRWIRTCPIYLTLFLAGLLMLGDLICLIYYFLSGDLSLRFVLKVVSIVFVAVPLVMFYRDALKRGADSMPTGIRALAYSAGAVAALLVVIGVALAGSPREARLSAFDTQKVEDLADIQRRVVTYWQTKGSLPPSLAAISDPIQNYRPPTDPQNKVPYGYRIMGSATFQLCANFNLEADESKQLAQPWMVASLMGSYWNHGAGHVCFTRTIDPSLYPTKNLPPAAAAPTSGARAPQQRSPK